MNRLREFVRLPTGWIWAGGLEAFKFGRGGEGSTRCAGLMLLIVLAQHADDQDGHARMTYDDLRLATGLSRAKIAFGLAVAEGHGLIARVPEQGASVYRLVGYDQTQGWAKLPASALYDRGGRLRAFHGIGVRGKASLDAVKLFLLCLAMRNNASNVAEVGYDVIARRAGIARGDIARAKSLLIAHGLLLIEAQPMGYGARTGSHLYRIPQLDRHVHAGTRDYAASRGLDPVDSVEF
jgi:hypothetical protein